MSGGDLLTVEDAKLYDRQIRLWGMEAQQRMRKTNILLAGMTGLSNEVAKNLILAGVNSLTLLDDSKVIPVDLGSQFFLRKQDIGENKAKAVHPKLQRLNPSVSVKVETKSILTYPMAFFESFEIICIFSSDKKMISYVNKIAHKMGKLFFASSTMGSKGFLFLDLNHFYYKADAEKAVKEIQFKTLDDAIHSHSEFTNYTVKKLKRMAHPLYFSIASVWEYKEKNGHFPRIENLNTLLDTLRTVTKDIENFDDFVSNDYLEQLIREWSLEVPCTCAVVGGILSQEILKCIAAKEVPLNNFLCFDSNDCVAKVLKL